MRRILMVLAVLAVSAIAVSSASASSGGVTILEGQGNTWFLQNPVNPGDSSTLVVTTQHSDEYRYATVTLTWGDAPLSFVSNGDSSANCVATARRVTCSYTDFSHTYKSDAYTLKVADNAPRGTSIPVQIRVDVPEEGRDTYRTSLEISSLPVAPPKALNGVFLCYSTFETVPGEWNEIQGASLFAAGYWSPDAVAGNVDGGTNISAFHLVCNSGGTATGMSIGGAGEIGTYSGVGHYPIVTTK